MELLIFKITKRQIKTREEVIFTLRILSLGSNETYVIIPLPVWLR